MRFHIRRCRALHGPALFTLLGVTLYLGDANLRPAYHSVTRLSLPPKAEAAASSFRIRNASGLFSPAYAYGDKTFSSFVTDSYQQASPGKADPADFYRWLTAAYTKTRRTAGPVPGVSISLPLGAALDAERTRLASIRGAAAKTRHERQVAVWAHRTVKSVIPRFSLERGFEFYKMAHGGERQCYSQSILIASLLQRAGISAGVAMVWKSPKGITSNNGHATVIARLSNGRHILVDASETEAFPRHQGLVARQNDQYGYVTPLFAKNDAEIVGYRRKEDGKGVSIRSVQAMDLSFLRSQFYYYRGERAPGGAFDSRKTESGLARSAQHLQTAVRLCPENSLAVYMLGRVYQRQGNSAAARAQFARAYGLYRGFGYLPEGPRDAFALAVSSAASGSGALRHRN